MTQEHSPLPWFKLHDDGVVYTKESTGPNTARYKAVCRNCSLDDAALIVRASNRDSAFDDHVKALEACEDKIGHAISFIPDPQFLNVRTEVFGAIQTARAALAKAKAVSA